MNDIYRSITKNISAREEKLFHFHFYLFIFLFSKFGCQFSLNFTACQFPNYNFRKWFEKDNETPLFHYVVNGNCPLDAFFVKKKR